MSSPGPGSPARSLVLSRGAEWICTRNRLDSSIKQCGEALWPAGPFLHTPPHQDQGTRVLGDPWGSTFAPCSWAACAGRCLWAGGWKVPHGKV